MVAIGYFVLGGVGFSIVAIAVIFFFIQRSWNIPVIVFKLVGDRQRPVLDLTRKGKIIVESGVRKLKIRGTPMLWEMRNFKPDNYYTTTMGKAALVLYEFHKDCYTPMRPSLWARLLGKKIVDKNEVRVPVFVPVGMDLKNEDIDQLMLKAIDDFDPDFIVRNFSRIDNQYTGGWRAFLKEYGWILGWVLLFVIALVAIILFFQKSPEMAAACANAALENGENLIKRMAATAAAPTG